MAAPKKRLLKDKKIFITAGPTWVPIDSVRVISNIATAETGILLAKEAKRQGAKVTLFIGPAQRCCLPSGIKIKNFVFFDELKKIIKRELSVKKYDIIIHSAAISDFKPAKVIKGKISSDKSKNLKLFPLPKIIKEVRRLNPLAKLVMFKLEPGLSDQALIKKARLIQKINKSDFCVANRINPYRAFIINRMNKIIIANSKKELTRKLLKTLT